MFEKAYAFLLLLKTETVVMNACKVDFEANAAIFGKAERIATQGTMQGILSWYQAYAKKIIRF